MRAHFFDVFDKALAQLGQSRARRIISSARHPSELIRCPQPARRALLHLHLLPPDGGLRCCLACKTAGSCAPRAPLWVTCGEKFGPAGFWRGS